MNVGKKWFQWFWVIEPLGGFGAEVFRLFRCCAPVSWTCCEGGKTMWVKSSKSEMTFLNSAVFSEACRICRCICRLICPIPSMGSGSKARKRRLDGCTQFVKFGTYPISIIYIFCPTGSDKKVYTLNFCLYLHEFNGFVFLPFCCNCHRSWLHFCWFAR